MSYEARVMAYEQPYKLLTNWECRDSWLQSKLLKAFKINQIEWICMHANKTQNGEKRCSSPEKIWKMKLKNQVELQQTINTMESGKLSYSIQPISLISKWNSLKAFIDQFTSMNSKLMPVVALAFSYHESASLMYDVLARRLCALWICFVQTWHIPILYHLKAERWENHFSISILNSTHL